MAYPSKNSAGVTAKEKRQVLDECQHFIFSVRI